jgi:hypothetical protein
MTITGGCHCGAVRYVIAGTPVRHGLCHCADCRRHAGAPVVAWAIFPAEALTVTRGATRVYASSEHGRREFCAACGTGLFYRNDDIFAGLVDVQSATWDDPDAFAPTEQIQIAERIGWMAGVHLLPAFERYPPMDE